MPTEPQPASFVSRHPYLCIFLASFALRLVVVVVLTRYFRGTFILDDGTYTQMARDLASGDTAHWDSYTHGLFRRTAAFVLPLVAVYEIVGPFIWAGELLVAIVGAATAAATAKFASALMPRTAAALAGVIVGFLPSLVIWSSVTLKDPFVWLVLVGLALAMTISVRGQAWRMLVWAAVTGSLLATLGFLRMHTFVVAGLAVAIASWLGERETRLFRGATGVLLAITIPWAVGIGPAGIDFVTGAPSLEEKRAANATGADTAVVDAPDDFVDEIAQMKAQNLSDQEMADQLGITESQVKDLAREGGPEGGTPDEATEEPPADPNLSYLPRGLVVVLLEPVPWGTGGSLSLRLARMESVIWYPILGFALFGLWRGRRNAAVLAFPVLAASGLILVYALAEGNIGTAYRHRAEVVWVAVVLATLGGHQLIDRRRNPLNR